MTRFILSLFVVCAAALSAAQPPVTLARDYACDMSMTGQGQSGTGTVISSAKAMRMNVSMQGQQAGVLINYAEQKAYMIMDAQKMYMVMPMGAAQMQDPTRDTDATWKKVGAEKVNGVQADKYEVVSKGETAFLWIDAAKSVMVRVQDADAKSTIDFTNYKMGAQPATAFALPAGYQPMDMGGMMPPGGP